MPYLEMANGINWYYSQEGEGPVLLFLHGWGVSGRIWRQQQKYFSKTHRVVVVDLPGHGRTNWCNLSFDLIVNDLASLLQQLGIGKVGIIGSSLGGLMALKFFENHEDQMKFLVLVGAHAKFSKSDDYPYGLDVVRIRKLSHQIDSHFPDMLNIFFRSLFTKEERATRRFKWIQTFRKTDFVPDKKALLEMLAVLEKQDLRHVLPRIKIPVQFINGTEDYICPKELFEYMSKNIPQAQFNWFDHCGHFPFLIKPYEFNQILGEFIKKRESHDGN